MKKTFSVLRVILIVTIIVALLYVNSDKITDFIMKNFVMKKDITTYEINEYQTNYKFNFVQTTDQFIVKDKQNILNVIYTVLNNGWNKFIFYCDDDYNQCLTDINDITKDTETLATINNMVNPYNSYSKLFISSNKYGRITLKINKLYSSDEITQINDKINSITTNYASMTNREKIKSFHDYLINNSVYDSDGANEIKSNPNYKNSKQSHKAIGPLFNGYALCSGYSDAMKIYLDQLKIPNYKITSSTHIWNLVYIDGTWLHLDLTWDDPVTQTGQNILLDKFFLITTSQLQLLDNTTHNFNDNYFKEAF